MYSVQGRAGSIAPFSEPNFQEGGQFGPYKGDDGIAKFAVVAAYILMVLSNALSATGLLGDDIGTVSKSEPTYVTPDGLTFSVWGLIYLLLFVLTVAQCCASPEDEMLLNRRDCLAGLSVRWRLVLAFVLNALWLPTFSLYLFPLSLIIIVAYLKTLVSILMDVNAKTTKNTCQWLLYGVPVSVNASWLVVATMANFFTVAGQLGWKDQYGVNGTVTAALLVVVLVVALGSLMAIALQDVPWALTAAWALQGLYRMHTVPSESFPTEAMSPVLAQAAQWGVILLVVASQVGLLLGLWMSCQSRPVPYAAPGAGPHMMMSQA